jgi:large subunit ribosomal protein L32
MAVPKKRKTHSKTRMGRSHHALTPNRWVVCAQCREPMTLHTICGSCGYYRSRPVVVKEDY